MLRVDAHHHLWRYNAEEFGWLVDDLAPLRRDFLRDELLLELRTAGVAGTVAIQARQSLEETEWLLEQAERSSPIWGVVGWLPLRQPSLPALLERLSARKKLCGVRHVLQSEPPGFMEDASFRRGIAALADAELTYDLLVFENQLEEAIGLVDSFPNQPFVLDHVGKPRIRAHAREPWASQLRQLAKRPNVFCKISGMVTEADPHRWTPEQLEPYLEVALEAFGPRRLMAGTDWPVILAGCTYSRWWSVLEGWLGKLSSDEQASIVGRNAQEFYRLQDPGASGEETRGKAR